MQLEDRYNGNDKSLEMISEAAQICLGAKVT
jgi:hypothetical protein